MHAVNRELESYIPIPRDQLLPDAALPFDVFIKDRSLVIPLFNRGTVYDSSARTVLEERGIQNIFIRAENSGELEKYLVQPKPAAAGLPDPETYNRYVQNKSGRHMIDRGLLVPGTAITFNLYRLHDFTLSPLAEAADTAPVTIDERILAASGDFVINSADVPRYKAYLDALFADRSLPSTEQRRLRNKIVKENSKLLIKHLIDEPRSGEKIKESIAAVNTMVDAILENKDAAYDLLTLRTYDYYTYTHSVNVAVLSVGLGMALGLPRETLQKLGIGAMLHDLGKGVIPLAILNKPSRLTEEEFAVMKTHVQKGAELLRIHREIPEESFVAVTQHHERISGKGYPHSRAGGDVALFGRITSIIDCYDAITTSRCYQPARTPFFALSVLTKESGDYDTEILSTFIKMLGELKEHP